MALLETIGSQPQQRYKFADLDAFVDALGIATGGFEYGSSKRLYAKAVLCDAAESILLQVAGELGVDGVGAPVIGPPANWRGTGRFRLFICTSARTRRRPLG